ncbi:hypothetical protein [Amycolatopsis sp. EV170708-02-1]|uniref:hypothetical protein n=1 Tax=Amycolatopsis sp. EV170708-02-1 TaxID=2919322 RepID=UPI001F0B7C06|nr:hypothetical protein [Amycolatopsis sp. EV170708-02-1]UMP06971.1 hypothetical protein MJQ72_20105 [Amycolatopsis sp. EV170708-02-1]
MLTLDVRSTTGLMPERVETVTDLVRAAIAAELGDRQDVSVDSVIQKSVRLAQLAGETEQAVLYLDVTRLADSSRVGRLPVSMIRRVTARYDTATGPGLKSHFVSRLPPKLDLTRKEDLLAFRETVVDEVMERAEAGRELGQMMQMPDIRLVIHSNLEYGSEVLNGMFNVLEDFIRRAVVARGGDPEALGVLFTRRIGGGSYRYAANVGITLHATPKRTAEDYRAISFHEDAQQRQLDESFIQHQRTLSEAARQRITWMVEGFTRRWLDSDEDNRPMLVASVFQETSVGFDWGYMYEVLGVVREAIAGVLYRMRDPHAAVTFKTILANSVQFTPYAYRHSAASAVLFDVLDPGQSLEDAQPPMRAQWTEATRQAMAAARKARAAAVKSARAGRAEALETAREARAAERAEEEQTEARSQEEEARAEARLREEEARAEARLREEEARTEARLRAEELGLLAERVNQRPVDTASPERIEEAPVRQSTSQSGPQTEPPAEDESVRGIDLEFLDFESTAPEGRAGRMS